MLGFEESFGYLIKPFVRDKDAIQAVLIVAEIAAYYRSRGMTLADGIEEIYKQYGYFAEKTISVTLSGVDGAAEIKKIMDKFRGNAPKQFNNTDIAKTEDFLEQTATTADGVEKLTTPPSNVLKYILADDSWFAVRPSGTEPKSNSTSLQLVNLKQMLKKNCKYRSRDQCFRRRIIFKT